MSTQMDQTCVAEYTVSGLNCSGCVATLTRKALTIDGIVGVEVGLDPGRVSTLTVRHDGSIDQGDLERSLEALGYRVALAASGPAD